MWRSRFEGWAGTGGSTGAGTGGVAGLGGTSGGGLGGSPGVGGSGGGRDGGAGGAGPSFDGLPSLDGLLGGDAAANACPADVATATCTVGSFCVRQRDGGTPDGCGCTNAGRWFCPGITIGADGGVVLPDGGLPDVGGLMSCPAGAANGVPCTTNGAICTGGTSSLGCACTQLGPALTWICL